MSTATYQKLKVQVQLVREVPQDRPPCESPDDVCQLVKQELAKADRERCLSLMLDARNRVIGIEEVSVGSLNANILHPREIFKSAILANAAAIILAHNHPSGSMDPSDEDLTITKRIQEAGKILGIDVVDHVIVGADGVTSFKEKALI